MCPVRRCKNLSRPENYDLFESSVLRRSPSILEEPVLPSIKRLYEMFDAVNCKYFDGKLPSVKISYSDRLLGAGLYYPRRKEIKIGVKYHQIFPEEVEDTLKHEMIHILHLRHDVSFKAWAKRLGTSLKARPHPSLRGKFKYLYTCQNCGKEYPRRKQLRMASCGVCSKRGKFDPEFKLILKKMPSKEA